MSKYRVKRYIDFPHKRDTDRVLSTWDNFQQAFNDLLLRRSSSHYKFYIYNVDGSKRKLTEDEENNIFTNYGLKADTPLYMGKNIKYLFDFIDKAEERKRYERRQ